MREFDELVEIVKRLRHPEKGCPWDNTQTHESLVPNFIEELYECVEAIEKNDMPHLAEELGDLMLHIVLQARIAEEEGHFEIAEVLASITDKITRRHPHIFGNVKMDTAAAVKLNWEQIKLKEKKSRISAIDGIPRGMPKLIVAQRMQEKAAAVGFDWDNHEQVFEKLDEEVIELKEAISLGVHQNIEDEIGDVLFTVVNLSRKLGFDSENSLTKTISKFERRFKQVEERFKQKQKSMQDSSLEELDEVWDAVKDTE
ncbi:MAG: nucleoside triphosphate pyrophosphohydrolase [Candidatus Cloacimonetes bacterium]|nr:nucleoside triphosphate pyrophosphohydrolase [Candidatus Cloacimonadota bacterium]